ncbi:MAG: surface carbohydrate biosynthesis protein [Candidatus Electronema sp. VV]
MKDKPLLIIPSETKVRELDAKLLLAVVALRKGFDVVVGALKEMKYLADLLDRGIFLDKSVTATKEKWFGRYRKLGHRIAALDEEGLVYFDAETYRQLRIYPPSMLEASFFFAWGPDQAEIIAPAIGSLAERIRVTGNPRFDLLRPELRNVYAEDVSILRRRHGRIILINTNFAFSNRDDDCQALHKTFARYPISKERPGFFEGWTAAQDSVMRSFQEMLPQLRQHFPEHTLIIRPHPSERLDVWQEFAAAMPKTEVIREGNVVPWIQACDALIHWNCTTAIEAYLLGKSAFAYRKEQSDQYEQQLPNACSFHACRPEELLRLIEQALAGTLEFSAEAAVARDEALRRHIASLDGKLAAEQIIDELLPLAWSFERKRSLSETGLRTLKQTWRAVLDQVNPARHSRDKYAAVKFPDTEIDEVRARVAVLAECLHYPAEISVRQAGWNCFSLTINQN